MQRKIAVIGAGSWGTCIAQVIAENNPDYEVRLWAYERHVVKSINEQHQNIEYLPNIMLSPTIIATGNLRDAVYDVQALIFGTPSKAIVEIAQRVRKHLHTNVAIAYLTKGFCKIHDEILTISSALSKIMPEHAQKIVAISGPSHAEEVIKKFHTCLLVAGSSPEVRRYFIEILNCDYLECREHEDILGVELGGTLKNPAAIAAGMLSVLPNCGDNLAGVLVTEALKEMCKLADAFGAKRETILDISGLGDLIATAFSDHSRNRRFGKDIARQIMKTGSAISFYDRIIMRFKPEYVLEKMSKNLNYLAEGAYAIEPLIEFAQKKGIEIPVYRALYEVLLNNRSTRLLIETVKNPDRFPKLLEETRLRAGTRKKGMEWAKGSVFVPIIIKKFENYISRKENLEAFCELIQKKHTPLAVFPNDHRYSQKERRFFAILENGPSGGVILDLMKLYLNETIDCFNPLMWRAFIFVLKVRNAMINVFRSDESKSIFTSNMRVMGTIREVRNVVHSANVVYVATFRSYLDFLFIMMAIGKFDLIPPRFLVNSMLVESPLRKFFIRRSGGYVVNIGRLCNLLYRETIKAYLTTLLEHGVPVLFFPELLFFRDGSLSEMSGEFISAIVDTLKRTTEEIALVPVEISYYKRPLHEIGGRNNYSWSTMMRNTVYINFSKPIMVSDYSHRNNALSIIASIIKERWKKDSFIFPHYVFCAILKNSHYAIHVNEARNVIRNILQHDERLNGYSPRDILVQGINFITVNGLGKVEGKLIHATAREEIDYYANLYGDLT